MIQRSGFGSGDVNVVAAIVSGLFVSGKVALMRGLRWPSVVLHLMYLCGQSLRVF